MCFALQFAIWRGREPSINKIERRDKETYMFDMDSVYNRDNNGNDGRYNNFDVFSYYYVNFVQCHKWYRFWCDVVEYYVVIKHGGAGGSMSNELNSLHNIDDMD